jgi:TolB protein
VNYKAQGKNVLKTVVIWFTVLSLASGGLAQFDEGKLVFSIRKPMRTLEGFRAASGLLRQGRGEPANWWQFFQYNIYTLNPDGVGLRQLTDDGMSRRPRWSPDGKWIAYVSGPENAQSLYVMTANGDEKTELLKRQIKVRDFWWSPNNHAILAAVETDRAVDPMESWIVTIDGESQKQRRMSQWSMGWFHWDAQGREVKEPSAKLIQALPEGVRWPEWSPDRRHIAFVTEKGLSLAEVESASVTGNWFSQRDEPPCDGIEEWSPDGKHILFYAAGDVCMATVAAGRVEEVVNLSMGNGQDATWSPDGKRMAFISRPAGRKNQEIFIVEIESGYVIQLTYTNYSHFDLHWR